MAMRIRFSAANSVRVLTAGAGLVWEVGLLSWGVRKVYPAGVNLEAELSD